MDSGPRRDVGDMPEHQANRKMDTGVPPEQGRFQVEISRNIP